MLTGTIVDHLKNLSLFLDTEKSVCEKTTYGEHPEFQPHIGQNYESNSERTLVISEIFSTKIFIKDRKKDESYCEYVLKNTNNPSCVNIQQALLRHDDSLTAENIAFCFFIHKEKVKVGSYRSNFSPKDLDNAINTLVPLINLLKPKKIVFLGSQTKRTVERRSGSKVLNGKTFERFLFESSIKTEVISLRASNEKKEDNDKFFNEIVIEGARNILENSSIQTDFITFLDTLDAKLDTLDDITNINESDILYALDKSNLIDDIINLIEGKECEKKFEETITRYYDDIRMDRKNYKSYIDDCVSFISARIARIGVFLDGLRYGVHINGDQVLNQAIKDGFFTMYLDVVYKRLTKEKDRLQCLLVPIKAIQDSLVEHTDISFSKVQFVKDLVEELRPKNDDDPGRVMSLQMVAKRLNENHPPITTALGKNYDSKGKGVIVLLRNVYKTLTESFFKEDRNIAAEMLHCFTKRPVVKVFVRNEDNVTEEEYWKPFKNMDAKEA